MGEFVITCPRLSLCVADGGEIHSEGATPELPRQVARWAARATADVQHRRSRRDAGSPGESQDLVRRQQALLPDVGVAIGQSCRGQPARPEQVVEAASVSRLTLRWLLQCSVLRDGLSNAWPRAAHGTSDIP